MPALTEYPTELEERAVRLVNEARGGPGGDRGACTKTRAAARDSVGHSPWLDQRAEIDNGLRPGATTDDATRLTELKREVTEPRRANAILRRIEPRRTRCAVAYSALSSARSVRTIRTAAAFSSDEYRRVVGFPVSALSA